MNRPNIIIVISDQQKFGVMGHEGGQASTPNFDRLASEGMMFENAFSSCPICSAYRGEVFTGKYPHKNGVVDNEYGLFPGQTTMAHCFKNAGYSTAWVGKWHMGYGPYTEDKRYGFDYMGAYNCKHAYYNTDYYENEEGPFHMDDFAPTVETDLALKWLDKNRDGNPFLLMMSWGPPHWPYDQYPDEFKTFKPEDVDLPGNVPEQMAEFARKEMAHYYGNVSALDREMGRLMSYIEENGLAENTIVCYTSDHGDHLSSHGYGKPMDHWMHPSMRASKATPYEESIHIPFIMRWPEKVKADSKSDVLFSCVDVMPTLLTLAGIDIPKEVQGTDISHAVLGKEGDNPDSVYLQILGPGWPHRGEWVGFWRGIRTERYVYARWQDRAQVWLFDRDTDPLEMKNLAGKPEYAEIEQKLEARLKQWIKETDDPFETGERDKDGMLKLGQYFTSDCW